MFKKLYLVDKQTLDKIKANEQERPALSYAEIYDSIVACKADKSKVGTEKLELRSWLKYRWDGSGTQEEPAGP
jgi:hypothetical protein